MLCTASDFALLIFLCALGQKVLYSPLGGTSDDVDENKFNEIGSIKKIKTALAINLVKHTSSNFAGGMVNTSTSRQPQQFTCTCIHAFYNKIGLYCSVEGPRF